MPIGQILGAVAGPATSLIGGFLQRNAAKKAAEQQAQAAEAAKRDVTAAGATAAAGVRTSGTEGRDRILDTLGFNDPYTNAGAKAVDQASALTEAPVKQFQFDPSTVGMDPGYLFRKQEAEKTQLQNAAAFGNLQSGGFAKAFGDRAAAEASQETDKVYGRQLQTFNTNQTQEQARLSNLNSIMGFGERANDARTAGTGDASRLDFTGQQLGGAFETDAAKTGAGLTTAAGTAQAVGTVNQSNATTGMLGTLGNIDWGSIFKKKAATP